nr:accessory gene regulator B family protein [Cohnella faecalis]
MINALALKLAFQLKEANPNHPASLDVLRYAIASIINTAGTAIVAIILSLLLGHFSGAALALISFAVLRMISGGVILNPA